MRAAALAGLLCHAACGDDSEDDKPQVVADGGQPATALPAGPDSGAPAARPDAGGATGLDATTPVTPPVTQPVTPPATPDAAAPADAGAPAVDASTGLELPKVLSLSGCEDLDVPALCSLSQTGGTFSANCGGAVYKGTIAADRAVTLTAPERTDRDGAKVNLTCTGKLQVAGNLTLDCKQTTGAVGTTPAAEAVCKLVSDSQISAGIACLELPAELTDVVVCKEGASQAGTTITGGTCKVTQDGCAFQAECANAVTLSGKVTRTGVTFSKSLKALADAYTPAMGTPAFLKGADANHTCTGTLTAGVLSGSCTAGGGRGTMPTSVCAIEGKGKAPATCENIAPAAEQLFVLDSCENLKNGEGQTPGIGEPVCAFRQNGCIWEVQCGNNPITKFSGRLTSGAKKVEWRLVTGTPCEMSFDTAGKITGKCTVPGQAACMLSSKDAVAGTASCPALPTGNDVKSHGCGGGDPLSCRLTLQHQCSYMGLCSFTANNDLVVAGTTSVEAGRPHFEFQGLGAYSCSVDKANEAEIASGDRAPNEWYGQCLTPQGGMCRDNYDPVAKTGFRGLRVYFDVPAGTTVPPTTTPVAPAPAAPAAQ